MFNVNAALAHQLTVYRNQLIKDDPNDRPSKDDILRTLSMLGLLELNKRYGNEELEVLTVTPKVDCNQKMVVIKQSNLEHIAIIMDGNRRWAKEKGLPSAAGHKKGVDALRRTVRACDDFGIKYLTVFLRKIGTEKRKRLIF